MHPTKESLERIRTFFLEKYGVEFTEEQCIESYYSMISLAKAYVEYYKQTTEKAKPKVS